MIGNRPRDVSIVVLKDADKYYKLTLSPCKNWYQLFIDRWEKTIPPFKWATNDDEGYHHAWGTGYREVSFEGKIEWFGIENFNQEVVDEVKKFVDRMIRIQAFL